MATKKFVRASWKIGLICRERKLFSPCRNFLASCTNLHLHLIAHMKYQQMQSADKDKGRGKTCSKIMGHLHCSVLLTEPLMLKYELFWSRLIIIISSSFWISGLDSDFDFEIGYIARFKLSFGLPSVDNSFLNLQRISIDASETKVSSILIHYRVIRTSE